MKKILIFGFILLALPILTNAQTECPLGLVNDPSPGSCGSFTDQDGNNLCDLSEIPVGDVSSIFSKPSENTEYISGEELKQYTVQEVAGLYDINAQVYADEISQVIGQKVKPSDSLQMLHDNYGLCSGVAGSVAINLKNQNLSSNQLQNQEEKIEPISKGKELYDFFPITIVLLFLYYFTWSLAKMKKISTLAHRRIWNVLLLLFFLVSGVLGLLLVIRINYGWTLRLPFNMLFWHVEAGIAMAIISLFHIAWHWRYYTCMLKRANKDKCENYEQQN